MFWKKVLCCAMIMLCLSGCGKSDKLKQQPLELRTALLEKGGCSFQADITVDFPDRAYDFSVTCDYHSGEYAKITVLSPDEIAGIAAKVSGSGASVEFDDVALDFGQLANGNVSAMEAAWLLAKCWDSAYISAAGKDGEFLRVTYLEGYGDGQLTVDTWLNEAGEPVRGEIAYDGMRCLTLEITQFQLNT